MGTITANFVTRIKFYHVIMVFEQKVDVGLILN